MRRIGLRNAAAYTSLLLVPAISMFTLLFFALLMDSQSGGFHSMEAAERALAILSVVGAGMEVVLVLLGTIGVGLGSPGIFRCYVAGLIIYLALGWLLGPPLAGDWGWVAAKWVTLSAGLRRIAIPRLSKIVAGEQHRNTATP